MTIPPLRLGHTTLSRLALRLPTHPSARAHPRALSTSASASAKAKQLCGSAPDYDRHVVVLGQPSSGWPSHLESVSPLAKAMGEWFRKPGLAKVGVTFGERDETGRLREGEVRWDSKKSKFMEPTREGQEESYTAYVYPDFTRLDAVSLSTLPAIEHQLVSLPPRPAATATTSPNPIAPPGTTHIWVCTHGTRDCRCGDLGEVLYQALVDEAERKRIGGAMGDGEEGVRIGRISHVGGHVWAANALVYRQGGHADWYGLLREDDSTELLQLATSPTPKTWWSRWRGRLGLSSEQCQSMLAEAEAKGEAGTEGGGKGKGKGKAPQPLGDSVELVFRTYGGEEVRVMGYEGETVMETARRHELESILATCGGACECATCAVHVAPATLAPSDAPAAAAAPMTGRQPVAVPIAPPVPEMTDEEDEQLDFALERRDETRLSCQLPVTKELGEWCGKGGRIELPQY